jgi:hypothetical protein
MTKGAHRRKEFQLHPSTTLLQKNRQSLHKSDFIAYVCSRNAQHRAQQTKD